MPVSNPIHVQTLFEIQQASQITWKLVIDISTEAVGGPRERGH